MSVFYGLAYAFLFTGAILCVALALHWVVTMDTNDYTDRREPTERTPGRFLDET